MKWPDVNRALIRSAALGAVLLLALVWASSASAFSLTTTLVPAGAVWSFLDDGADPPANWISPYFDDIFWASGSAKLGYGNGDEETELNFGPDPKNKHITYYFRRSFVAEEASAYTNLTLSLLRDDGAVVYLNGTEVFRNNMPSGPINYRTLASTNVGPAAELIFFTNTVHVSFLAEGTNVLAVEVHQFRTNSTDLSFDLQLTGTYPVLSLVRGPYLQQGSTTNLLVKWRTDLPSSSRVSYGLAPNRLNRNAGSDDLTTEHEVRLADLQPNTKYFYAIGAGSKKLAGGDSYFFVTSPLGGKPTRIWALGDAGTAAFGPAAERVRDAYYSFAEDRYTDLWLMLGDNAYYSGSDLEYQAAVFNFFGQMLRQSVLWTTIGNHETYSTPPGGELPYLGIFSLPTRGEVGGVASGTERYYSFDYGNIHFVCLDSMTSQRTSGSPMLTWLEQDLAANTNEWLIAFWHHPPYTKGSHDSDWEIELIQMRQNALPLLESYGVDLVLSGHSHCYERSYLLDGHYGRSPTLLPEMIKDSGSGNPFESGPYIKTLTGPVAHQGAVYIVAGSSGQATGGALNHPAMYVSLNELGSLVLDIDGSKLEARFLQADGSVADYFQMVKGNELRITSLRNNDGLLTLTWKSEEGKFYRVERATSLRARDWHVAEDGILATGNFTSWMDFLDGLSSAVFYRVVGY